MDKCILCGNATSFKFDGEGEYNSKPVCPKCQKEKLGTNFNTGCAKKEECYFKTQKKN